MLGRPEPKALSIHRWFQLEMISLGKLETCRFLTGSRFSDGESKGLENTLLNHPLLCEQVATISFAIWCYVTEFRVEVFD